MTSSMAPDVTLAYQLLQAGRLVEAETACRRALTRSQERDAHAWTALGVVLRAGQRIMEAELAYRRALQVAPAHVSAHHNLGALLSHSERADEALVELERAQALGLDAAELYINLGRTLAQLYRLEEAERAYEQAVIRQPRSPQAQSNLAALRYMRGDPQFARDIARAARDSPADAVLQLAFADLLRQSGDSAGSEALLRKLIANDGPAAAHTALATVLRESGRVSEAEMLLLQIAAARPQDSAVIENLVAAQLTLGRAEEALPFIRKQRQRRPDDQRWIAYEATAAREVDPGLKQRLFDYGNLVRTYEIEAPAPWRSVTELNAALERALGARHQFATHPLDQSLRHGSQTARSLLTEQDVAIQGLLSAFAAPLADYQAAIGKDPSHPLTARNRGSAALQGCWSVALRKGGFHVNHVHPQGWISSAYYVSVPEEACDVATRAGWIKFGEPRWPGPNNPAEHFVQPRAGRLVLFPSYLWHGTNAILGNDTRLTVAFDAVPT